MFSPTKNEILELKKKTKNSQLQTYIKHQASKCSGYPLKGWCFKAKGNRIIECNY